MNDFLVRPQDGADDECGVVKCPPSTTTTTVSPPLGCESLLPPGIYPPATLTGVFAGVTGGTNMAQAPAMPVFTDALIGDTTHLSAEEFGAYCLLLFATWRNNGEALPDDPRRLSRICRVTERRWIERLRPALIGFFDLRADRRLHQKRLEKEWNHVRIISARQAQNVSARWLKTKDSEDTTTGGWYIPDGYPHTHTHKEKDPLKGVQKESSRKPRREIPEDWVPDAAGVAYAAEHAAWRGQRLSDEVEHFRNHHRRSNAVFADLPAAWRTWVQQGKKFDARRRKEAPEGGVAPFSTPGFA